MGFLSKKVQFFLISLLTTFPVCGMIQTVGNVTDTVSYSMTAIGSRKERCG